MSEINVLAIDVGNSRIKAGLFDAPAMTGLPVCRASVAFPVDETSPAAAVGRWLMQQDARPVASLLGGVNPPVIAAIREKWTSSSSELTVIERPASQLLANRTDAPDRVGPDRLFDAVAANRLRRANQPAIVIDSGTATTINLIDGSGAFLGGAIVAGFGLMAAALHERTSLLPLIDAVDLSPPPLALGRNTNDALRSGLYWNLVGGVKELVARFSDIALETSDEQPLVLLTGGASPLLVPHLPASRHEPHLTLQGLVLSDPSIGQLPA